MFRYASFNRPLWNGFDPGHSFNIVEVTESDWLNGRKPHDVIETFVKISPDTVYQLQLTDYAEVKEKRMLIEYAQTKLTGSYLGNVISNINRGVLVYKEQIDFYANKAKEIQDKITARKNEGVV